MSLKETVVTQNSLSQPRFSCAGTAMIAAAPPIAIRFGAAAGMMSSLGAVALARDAASGNLVRSAVGALAGAAVTWQGLRMVQGRLAEKSAGVDSAQSCDVESQSVVLGSEVALSIISLEATSPPNGYARGFCLHQLHCFLFGSQRALFGRIWTSKASIEGNV